jgi:hypothetical protein
MVKVNLEEILRTIVFPSGLSDYEWSLWFVSSDYNREVIKAMKEACRQVLELAAENAELDSEDENDMTGVIVSVNRQSITDTINQVE